MTAEEKKRDLYLRQKQLLDTFLEHGAISRAQYDKSLGDLTVKMGMSEPVSGKMILLAKSSYRAHPEGKT